MEQQGTNPPFIVTDGLTKTYIRREKPEHGGITRLWRRETREVQALRDVSCPRSWTARRSMSGRA